MKKLWKKIKQILAWVGALALGTLAVLGSVLLFRKKDSKKGNYRESLEEVFEREKKIVEAQKEAQELSHELAIEKAKNKSESTARRLEHSPDDLAAALTSLSDD